MFFVKEYYNQYKPFIVFLTKFFAMYLLLTVAYRAYLHQFDEKKHQVDGITKMVANQSVQLLSVFDDKSYTFPSFSEASMKVYYKNQWISRIIEGCNAMSVIILFISFVVSFSGKPKQMALFILGGSGLIYILNIVRIALLNSAIYFYPKYESVLHEVVFPVFIYGVVFILWVIWVNKFSTYDEIDAKK